LRQQRNFLITLLLSQGTPMLLGGDELGRTQGGNNNAWCQDNEISWFDWARDSDRFSSFLDIRVTEIEAWSRIDRPWANLLTPPKHHRTRSGVTSAIPTVI
jgi:pullulanase/glycogen debranching enzyme